MSADKRISYTLYTGVCPECGRQWQAQFLVKKQRIEGKDLGTISPPKIAVACQCEIPVVSMELHYAGHPTESGSKN